MLAQTHREVIAEIEHDVLSALQRGEGMSKDYVHPGTALTTAVELEEVRLEPGRLPAREGSISSPGFGGYSPAGVFRKTVEKTLSKAKRRQAHGVPGAARALVVYVMGTQIAADLAHEVHGRHAQVELEDVDPQAYGLDAIAFVVRALPRGLAAIFTVADDTTLTIAQVQAMFGSSS